MTTKHGRASIFRGKDRSTSFQALLTPEGARIFAARRAELATLAKRELDAVTNADTIEFCVRGTANTKAYLKQQA